MRNGGLFGAGASSFAAFAITSLVPAAGPAFAATQWGAYQWQSPPANLPIVLNVATSASGTDWNKYLSGPLDSTGRGQGAAESWSVNTNGLVGFAPQSETAQVDRRKCPARTGQVEVCNYTYGRNGWLGIAQIWTSGNFIQKGTVKLNDTYFNMAAYSGNGWKYLVACQEVGHTVGLSHDDTSFNNPNYGSCMDYTSSPDAAGSYHDAGAGVNEATIDNRMPNDNDYGLLVCIYSNPTSGCPASGVSSFGNTLQSSLPGAGDTRPPLKGGPTDFGIRDFSGGASGAVPDVDAGNSPAEWGKAVAFTRDGRGRVFERVIGEGQKIITEVFWAPQ